MLERIREGSQGPAAKIILVLIILSFALAGIGGYLGQTTEQAVAQVNGVEISQSEYARAYENEKSRLEQQLGEYYAQVSADPSYMAQMRQSVVDRLVQQELQLQLAERLGLRTSDEEIKATILTLPYFQLGGKFNNDRYLQVLRQLGFQADGFREYLRNEMTRSQLVSALAGSDFVLANELDHAVALQQQQRSVDYVVIDKTQFADQVKITEEAIADYYNLNQAQFLAPEKVKVAYIELTANDVTLPEPITEQAIAEYYEQNKAQYSEPEKRRVAHILIDNSEDDAAAKEKATALLNQLKEGADFAQLAKTSSDDEVSAEMGGDLDWIERDMLDPEFEKAAFALAAVGDTSALVQSEFGYHIIKLTDLEKGQTTPLESVKAQLKQELEATAKADLFYEKQTQIAELAFEMADSLDDAAEAAGVEVKHTELVSRNNLPAPLNQSTVQSVVFSPELIEDGVNSEVLELGNEHIAVVRVSQHQAATTEPLAQVSEQIKQQLTQEQTTAAAKEKAQGLFAQLQAGTSLAELATADKLTLKKEAALMRQSYAVSPALIKQVFKLPHPVDGKAVNDMVTLNNGDVALVSLLAVNTPPAPEKLDEQLKQRFTMQQANKDYLVFLNALEAQAEVTKPAQAAAVEQE